MNEPKASTPEATRSAKKQFVLHLLVLLALLAITLWVIPWGIWPVRAFAYIGGLVLYRTIGALLAYRRVKAGILSLLVGLLPSELGIICTILGLLSWAPHFDVGPVVRGGFYLLGTICLIIFLGWLTKFREKMMDDRGALDGLASQRISWWERFFFANLL